MREPGEPQRATSAAISFYKEKQACSGQGAGSRLCRKAGEELGLGPDAQSSALSLTFCGRREARE